jgi:hypothetical protein
VDTNVFISRALHFLDDRAMHNPKLCLAVLLPLLLACDDPFESSAIPMQFQQISSDQTLPSVNVTGEDRQITIEGRYLAMQCGSIAATAERNGNSITVRVVPRSNTCDAIIHDYAYRATLLPLPGGDYTVRVSHWTDQPGHHDFSHTVTVHD